MQKTYDIWLRDPASSLAMIYSVENTSFSFAERINAIDLENVYRRTNIVETTDDWNYRSLSVGDIVLDVEENKAYMCDVVGWREVPNWQELLINPGYG